MKVRLKNRSTEYNNKIWNMVLYSSEYILLLDEPIIPFKMAKFSYLTSFRAFSTSIGMLQALDNSVDNDGD